MEDAEVLDLVPPRGATSALPDVAQSKGKEITVIVQRG